MPGEWGDSSWPPVTIRGKAVGPATVLELPTGQTTVTIGKGPEFLPQTVSVNLANPGETYTVNVALEPALDLFGRGWRGGDAHIHYFHGDNQVVRTPEEAFTICAAAGLSWASFAGEHYGAALLNRTEALAVWERYDRSECQLWLGAEAPKNAWGHHASIAYDPWSVREALPYNEGIQEIHAQGGVSFPVHPERLFPFRSFGGSHSFYPLNNHFKHLPMAALAGHLLDGWSAISDQPSGPTFLATYRKLLSLGYKIPLLADSDYCMDRINNGLKAPGFWMNYVHLDGQPLSRAAVAEAIRKGRVFATTGPLALFTVGDAISGASLPADGRPRPFKIEASYRFNPWTLSYSNFAETAACVIERIELLRNGEVVRQWTPSAATATIEDVLPGETNNCSYMVRVLGNEGVWMAGYASPIYFETAPAPRQPPVFKPIINGRLYDAATGEPLAGTVSSVRGGRVEWTVPTDANGMFRARVPIDAMLVARDANGRELKRDWLSHEPIYAFGHYLPERYPDKAKAIDDFTELAREMTWEFPIGRQAPASYVKQDLAGSFPFTDVQVLDAPPRISGKQHTEIVALLVDKTQVQHGDTINYAVIFRSPDGQTPKETLQIQFGGWDPNFPRMYTRYSKLITETRPWEALVDLGNGFYMRQNSMVVPDWVRNLGPSSGAVRMRVTVRTSDVVEDAILVFRLGATRRQLLASTMWDGLVATWGGRGVGPCDFSREIAWLARYPDYRQAAIRVRDGSEEIVIRPREDTAQVADADDAIFEDHYYYDAQCEPEYRNVPFRDPVRPQPQQPNFSGVALADPADTTPPVIAAMEPKNGGVIQSPVRFYYFIDDLGQSGAAAATLLLNGEEVASDTTQVPIVLELPPGNYTWQVRGSDRAGNVGLSEVRTFRVTAPGEVPPGPEPSEAEFLGEDRSTAGSWKGKYGQDGYNIVGDTASYPTYAQITPSGHNQWVWASTTTAPRALERATATTRLAACYYASAPYEIRFALRDANEHRVSLYFLDWDGMGREQHVELIDTATGNILDSRVVSAFSGGAYLSWNLKGEVVARIHPLRGNAVVSGIFLDPPGSPAPAAQSPEFNPPAGTYEGSLLLSLSSPTTGAAIHYTLDGSTPTANSPRYNGPFTLHTSSTVRAIVFGEGLQPSGVAIGEYVITPPAPGSAQVEFRGIDRLTQGNWKGAYGQDGHAILGDTQSLPGYASLAANGAAQWTWVSSSSDPRAPQRAGSGRVAGCWYSAGSFDLEITISGNESRSVSFYCLDWDRAGRKQQIEVFDRSSGERLHSLELSNFGEGAYVTFAVRGQVRVRFANTHNPNAVLSAVFFDTTLQSPEPPPASSAEFLGTDSTVRGDWLGKYGTKGHLVVGDSQALPQGTTVGAIGKLDWTWTAASAEARVLQRANGAGRIAACWYSGGFEVDLKTPAGEARNLSLYFLDWDRAGRAQRVEILDGHSRATLHTRELSGFGEGTWLRYAVSGHVAIRVTRVQGNNAVLNGLFLD
jgi:hypothetical protein